MKKLIYSQEDVDLMISIETQQYQKDLEYEQYCNEQLRNKITNLEYKIKKLEEDNKYKIVLDKIKEYINKHCVNQKVSKEVGYKCFTMADTQELEHIYKLLEEIE